MRVRISFPKGRCRACVVRAQRVANRYMKPSLHHVLSVLCAGRATAYMYPFFLFIFFAVLRLDAVTYGALVALNVVSFARVPLWCALRLIY